MIFWTFFKKNTYNTVNLFKIREILMIEAFLLTLIQSGKRASKK